MLQVNEIQKRFTQIEQTIEKAAQACRSDSSLPQSVQNCIQQLDQQSGMAKKVIDSKNEVRIRQALDDLEKAGDQAEKACQDAKSVNARISAAISQAHTELSDLKRQLH